jgi:hypothetical protein
MMDNRQLWHLLRKELLQIWRNQFFAQAHHRISYRDDVCHALGDEYGGERSARGRGG